MDDFWPRPQQVPICWLLAAIIAIEVIGFAAVLIHRFH